MKPSPGLLSMGALVKIRDTSDTASPILPRDATRSYTSCLPATSAVSDGDAPPLVVDDEAEASPCGTFGSRGTSSESVKSLSCIPMIGTIYMRAPSRWSHCRIGVTAVLESLPSTADIMLLGLNVPLRREASPEVPVACPWRGLRQSPGSDGAGGGRTVIEGSGVCSDC